MLRAEATAGGSLEFKELEWGSCVWESQKKRKQQEMKLVRWVPAPEPCDWLTCPAAHLPIGDAPRSWVWTSILQLVFPRPLHTQRPPAGLAVVSLMFLPLTCVLPPLPAPDTQQWGTPHAVPLDFLTSGLAPALLSAPHSPCPQTGTLLYQK